MRYVTHANLMPFGGMLPYTAWFDSHDGHTQIKVVFGKPVHSNPILQSILGLMVRLGSRKAERMLHRNYTLYQEIVAELAASQADNLPPEQAQH